MLSTFMLGGPLSVTALSAWQVRRLRSHRGITLASALGRRPPHGHGLPGGPR
ncbi:hypothetical protein [Streptomyces sp. NPDC001502]|uniref:hypothetical protein n=1 Tax=Streptomyces sp. NPDC001502 TaxID=3364578 RepID=UPI0036ADABE0